MNFLACRYCIRVDKGVPFLSAVGEGLTLTEGNTMKAEFITTQYEWAHGKKPRGTGTWAFTPADSIWPDRQTMPHDAIAWAWGSYIDAKREVAAKFPQVDRWTVLS